VKLRTATGEYVAVASPIADRRQLEAIIGRIPLVSSRGQDRSATYRGIYLTNPWVWAAVNTIARGYARTPLHVFELDEVGDRRRVRGDVPQTPGRPAAGAALDRLLSSPSTDRSSRFARWHSTVVDRLVYGSALWTLERSGGGGQPTGCRHVSWRRVRTYEDAEGDVGYYEIGAYGPLGSPRGRPRRVAPDDVVHFGRGTDPEGTGGISPLESCKHTLALHEAVVRHLLSYFANSARLSGHLKVDKVTKEKARDIRDMLVDLYTSPENAGRVAVTSGEWQSISDTPEHSQVVELVKLSREEIAAAYSIPPPVLGILDQAIKSNVKELREQYVRDSVGSWAAEFEEEIQAQLLTLVPSWRNLFVESQLAEQLRPDLEARAEVYQKMKHVLSIDDMRRMENKPPFAIKGVTDVPWLDSGALPVTAFAGGQAAAAQVAAAIANSRNGHQLETP